MEINASRYYDNNYEIIDGTRVRFIEIEGPYAHMLPNRNSTNKDERKNFFSKLKSILVKISS